MQTGHDVSSKNEPVRVNWLAQSSNALAKNNLDRDFHILGNLNGDVRITIVPRAGTGDVQEVIPTSENALDAIVDAVALDHPLGRDSAAILDAVDPKHPSDAIATRNEPSIHVFTLAEFDLPLHEPSRRNNGIGIEGDLQLGSLGTDDDAAPVHFQIDYMHVDAMLIEPDRTDAAHFRGHERTPLERRTSALISAKEIIRGRS